MLTFEKEPFQGVQAIVGKLEVCTCALENVCKLTSCQSLPFQKVQHRVDTTDCQPNDQGGILVLVTGALIVDDQQQPMSYVQIFTLMPESGSFFVYNDMFRLVYPAH